MYTSVVPMKMRRSVCWRMRDVAASQSLQPKASDLQFVPSYVTKTSQEQQSHLADHPGFMINK